VVLLRCLLVLVVIDDARGSGLVTTRTNNDHMNTAKNGSWAKK